MERNISFDSKTTPTVGTSIIFDVKTGKKRCLQTPVIQATRNIPSTTIHKTDLLIASFNGQNARSINKVQETTPQTPVLQATFGISQSTTPKTDLLIASFNGQTANQEQSINNVQGTTPQWFQKNLSNTQDSSYSLIPIRNQSTTSISEERLVQYETHGTTIQQDSLKLDHPTLGVNQLASLPSTLTFNKRFPKRLKTDKVCSSVRFTKEMLRCLNVIGQVDDRFIACLFYGIGSEYAHVQRVDQPRQADDLLVLVDQHAAHERIRLERFLKETKYYENTSNINEKTKTSLRPPVQLTFYENELHTLLSYQKEFFDVGLEFAVCKLKPQGGRQKLYVQSVPSMLARACTTQSSINHGLLKEFLLEQMNSLKTTSRTCNVSSVFIFKILASHACHGAIKFGDRLTREQCVEIISDLSECQLPFQCAHGRPSIAPLLTVTMLSNMQTQDSNSKPNLAKLKRKF